MYQTLKRPSSSPLPEKDRMGYWDRRFLHWEYVIGGLGLSDTGGWTGACPVPVGRGFGGDPPHSTRSELVQEPSRHLALVDLGP